MNEKYIWEKFMLMVLASEIISILFIFGFYAGQVHAIRDSDIRYHAGIVTIELDGNEYIHIAEE